MMAIQHTTVHFVLVQKVKLGGMIHLRLTLHMGGRNVQDVVHVIDPLASVNVILDQLVLHAIGQSARMSRQRMQLSNATGKGDV
jgi:hypothetical protein|tara:strand:+ start:360 stop:611 length:252 start_codon:yes stop_codon:yes gene_type:complete